MTDEERALIATAIIILDHLPGYSDIPIDKGLEDLARMIEETK